MCGISVIVGLHGPAERTGEARGTLEEELNQSLRSIRHRGPDSQGTWISPDRRVALGHTRLAINDLSHFGNQPFHDGDAVHAVVNGEIYDDNDELRTLLVEKSNFRFQGRSDCELVIALYKYFGLSFLSKLRGEFSLCLYDSTHRHFIAARDRYGIKPLFYNVVDGRLLIAAEAKAFLPLGWVPEWDVKSIIDAGWINGTSTLFKNVSKIRPGHYLISRDLSHFEQRCYWDIDYPDKNRIETRTEAEMIQGLRDRLFDAIRVRLRADVPVGVYLSGGLDSSVIAGMVDYLVKGKGHKQGNRQNNAPMACFTIKFDENSGVDESLIASNTARDLQANIYLKHMTEKDLAADFEAATLACEHHNPDLNYVGKFALSSEVREKGFTVVLTGEGSDENFGGYPTYLTDFLREPDPSWPAGALTDQHRQSSLTQSENKVDQYYRNLGTSIDRGPSVPSRMLNNISTVYSIAAYASYHIYEAWTGCFGGRDERLTVANNIDGCARDKITAKWHPLHSAQYVWIKSIMANIILSCLGDRTEMAHSVEARTPFLDHHLTEYVNGLPPSMKIRYDEHGRPIEKWILREAARPYISTEIYERTKQPYAAPSTYAADGPVSEKIHSLLTRENVEALGFVDWSQCQNLIQEAFLQKKVASLQRAIVVCQWIVIGRAFKVHRAQEECSFLASMGETDGTYSGL